MSAAVALAISVFLALTAVVTGELMSVSSAAVVVVLAMAAWFTRRADSSLSQIPSGRRMMVPIVGALVSVLAVWQLRGAPVEALSVVMAAVAICSAGFRGRHVGAAKAAAVTGLVMLSAAGLAAGLPVIARSGAGHPAGSLPAIVSLTLIAWSVLASRPDPWLVDGMVSSRPAAVIGRRVLSSLLALSVVLPLMARMMGGIDRLDTAYGLILTVAPILVVACVVLQCLPMVTALEAGIGRSEDATMAAYKLSGGISHRLRSPLNALRGWAFLLADAEAADPGLRERAIGGLRRNVDELARLLDEMTDVHALARDAQARAWHPVDLAGIVSTMIEQFRSSADSARIDVCVDMPGNPLTVLGDESHLRDVVVSLMGGVARRVSAGGTVKIEAHEEGDVCIVRIDGEVTGDHRAGEAEGAAGSTSAADGRFDDSVMLRLNFLVEIHGGALAVSRGVGATTCLLELPLHRSGAARRRRLRE